MATKKMALITGASSGIGYELAKIHAAHGDNLILVARSEGKLNELAENLRKNQGISVTVIAADLSELNAPKALFDKVQAQQLQVDYLINNAGFGDYGKFVETDWEKEKQMIQLNITALTELTKLFLPQMVEKKYGKIMNVASTAAFQPGPLMAIYYATKSYVLHFSEAINNEVAEFGVSVTALCPGATESGFQSAAQMEDSKLVKGKKLPSSKEIAQFGFNAMMRGKEVAIPGFMNKLMVFFLRFTPRSWVVKLVRKIQDRK